jgi:hypothetical protein
MSEEIGQLRDAGQVQKRLNDLSDLLRAFWQNDEGIHNENVVFYACPDTAFAEVHVLPSSLSIENCRLASLLAKLNFQDVILWLRQRYPHLCRKLEKTLDKLDKGLQREQWTKILESGIAECVQETVQDLSEIAAAVADSPPQKPLWEQIEVDQSQGIVHFGDKPLHVAGEAARMLQVLCDAKGEWVAMYKNGFTKPSDTKKSLPAELCDLIESESGKGYRLRQSCAGSPGQ